MQIQIYFLYKSKLIKKIFEADYKTKYIHLIFFGKFRIKSNPFYKISKQFDSPRVTDLTSFGSVRIIPSPPPQ